MIGFNDLSLLFVAGGSLVIGLLICCKISETFGKDMLIHHRLLGYMVVFGFGCMGFSIVLGVVIGVLELIHLL